MLRSKWMGTLALALVLASVVSAGVAEAAPAVRSTAESLVTFDSLFQGALEWILGWGNTAREGTLPDRATVGASKEGPMIDPNGGTGEASASSGVCGDEGPMIDPNGGSCSP